VSNKSGLMPSWDFEGGSLVFSLSLPYAESLREQAGSFRPAISQQAYCVPVRTGTLQTLYGTQTQSISRCPQAALIRSISCSVRNWTVSGKWTLMWQTTHCLAQVTSNCCCSMALLLSGPSIGFNRMFGPHNAQRAKKKCDYLQPS